MTEPCPMCDGEASLVREPKELIMGDRPVTVMGEIMRCSNCGEGYFLPGQLDALQRAAVDQIRREDGLLDIREIKRFREELGIAHADMERLLGTGAGTVARWERGTVTQSGAADTLLRMLMRDPSALQELALERGVRIKARSQTRVA